MKLKTIINYLLIAFLAIGMGSCTNKDEDSKFDQTPTERLQARQKELSDLLLSSEQGWKLVYFTDNTQLGGFTHLFKFKDTKNVEMASDFDATTLVKNTSEYSIDMGSTVSLVFTTGNYIHLLSDSATNPNGALRGKGYKGDFQFLYYGQENGQIIFRSNRTAFIELRFVKATAQDWTDLASNIVSKKNLEREIFQVLETNDGATTHKLEFNFNSAARFANPFSTDPTYDKSYSMAIQYTPTGFSVVPAIEVANQKLSEFKFDALTGFFTATGTNNVSATVKFQRTPFTITDDYKILLAGAGQAQTVFGFINPYLSDAQTNSPLCLLMLDAINATLPATQKLSRIQMFFNTPYGNYIEYRFAGGLPSLYHEFTVVENPTKKTIILLSDIWHDGTQLIPEPDFLKDLDSQLFDPEGLYVKKENFKIQFTNTVYTFTSASSSFRITTYKF
jgi:hypothetical protein